MLPKTLRVSAVTDEGLEDLKLSVLQLMESTDWATQVQVMKDRDESALTATDDSGAVGAF